MTTKTSIIPFIKDVSKYFMDFLETDFHKRKNPKRSIQFRNSSNLLVGIPLSKYPTFNKLFWKAASHNFDKTTISSIRKNIYRTSVPENLLDLIKLQVDKITQKDIKTTISTLSEEVIHNSVLHKAEFETALVETIDSSARIIKKDLVLPFIKSIEKSIEKLNLGDENNLYLMEEELTAVLIKNIEDKLSATLKVLISGEKVNTPKEISSIFDLNTIQNDLITFFENFKIGDLFSEIYEMDRNKAILDKQEFYVYFCDITFNGAKYPIFYIPVNVTRQGESLSFEFDSQIYINKKALEYIAQEYNLQLGKHGTLKEISERIIYISENKDDLISKLQSIIQELINYFDLDAKIDLLNGEVQTSRSLLARISNNCYVSLFDKSDEALVNDYEEILELLDQEDNQLTEAFNRLIDDFIHNNPDPVNPIIEEEWDNTEPGEKLTNRSPIPLNSEQIQILKAINQPNCKYLIVEGPPGTGKSHTITAIAFDSILKGKSVLVLSDKKEALDVVEDKITETMNKVRFDKNFQNPILRLGKTGNTYSQILSASSLENIKTHYRVVKRDYSTLESNIDKASKTLHEDLEAEILANKEISLEEIKEFVDLESYFAGKSYPVDLDELIADPNSSTNIEEALVNLTTINEELLDENNETKSAFLKSIHIDVKKISKTSSLMDYINIGKEVSLYLQKLRTIHSSDLDSLLIFDKLSEESQIKLSKYVQNYKDNKQFLVGYLFRKKQIDEIDNLFRNDFSLPKTFIAHEQIKVISKIIEIIEQILTYKTENQIYPKKLDLVAIIHNYMKDESLSTSVEQLLSLNENFRGLNEITNLYPKTFKKLEISPSSLEDILSNKLFDMPQDEYDKLLRYIYLTQKLDKDFSTLPEINYSSQVNTLQDLVTTQMTYLLDGRLVDFYEHNKSTATNLRNIIRAKRKFPKEEFLKLKQAFPCILAGIRDYAEFIPLEPEMFDLLIIDEASQVSIAQSFPALLRAKKILILGDKKQFSNIKSAQAKSDTNTEYLNNVRESFKRNISKDPSELNKLEKFNIRTSILEFFEYISNYNTQLLKHFRGYKENISYSNKYFYQDNLQVMKIRGKHIDEVIKFTFIEHDGKVETIANSNSLEVEKIIKELEMLKDARANTSVGIITPHTNQQKLFVERINLHQDKDYFFEQLKLKIMTFDTCQGEERDTIFYSMVATKEEDHLWGVFIKDLNSVDIEEDGKIKAQRLNVGFSRSKECMHFFLSKPLDQYNGSIGEALRHYHSVLQDSKKEHSVKETDSNSKMEPAVLNWFYQTEFWKNNKDRIEFIPQFELGKYLKQLDKFYNHPNYKVDFLLTYLSPSSKNFKIIIEYDGFLEHFTETEGVNEFNYQEYYSENDLYRQKVLESYGYKFIRINRFNAGKNPFLTLSDRLAKAIKDESKPNNLLDRIHFTINNINDGVVRECPKCKEFRQNDEFKDPNLLSGYGRFCNHCKSSKVSHINHVADQDDQNDLTCPKCSSPMRLRSGRYGKFYGCSKFPYCRGTRQYRSN